MYTRVRIMKTLLDKKFEFLLFSLRFSTKTSNFQRFTTSNNSKDTGNICLNVCTQLYIIQYAVKITNHYKMNLQP